MTDNIIPLDAIRRYRAGVKLRAAESHHIVRQNNMMKLTSARPCPIILTPCTSFSLSSDNLAELSSEAGKVELFFLNLFGEGR